LGASPPPGGRAIGATDRLQTRRLAVRAFRRRRTASVGDTQQRIGISSKYFRELRSIALAAALMLCVMATVRALAVPRLARA